jgi:large repetitive protein
MPMGSVRPLAAEIISNTAASNGTVVRNADGTFTYTPNAGFDGNDSFTYTVRNADGATDTATVRITVTPTTVDARDDMASVVRADHGGTGQVVINVKANDVDPEGDAFSVTRVVTQPSIGTATLNADGTITYVADASRKDAYNVTFTYEVTDDCGAKDIATVTVHVAACPPEPKRP